MAINMVFESVAHTDIQAGYAIQALDDIIEYAKILLTRSQYDDEEDADIEYTQHQLADVFGALIMATTKVSSVISKFEKEKESRE